MIAETDSLLDRIRAELSSQRTELDVPDQAPAAPSEPPAANGQPAVERPAGPLLERIDLQPGRPDPDSFHIRDLLRYYDQRFLDFAYRCLLKRDRDAGADYHLARLRGGKSRIDILHKLRYGREGRQRGVPVPGMRMRRVLSVLTRIPLIGYVIDWLCCLASLPRQQQRFRQWQHHTMWLFTELESHLHRNYERLETALANPASQAELRSLSARVAKLGVCLSNLEAVTARLERPRQDDELQPVKAELEQLGQRINQLETTGTAQAEFDQQLAEVGQQATELGQRQAELEQRQAELDEHQTQLGQHQAELDQHQTQLSHGQVGIGQHQTQLRERQAELEERQAELAQIQGVFDQLRSEVGQRQVELGQRQLELGQRQLELDQRQVELGQQVDQIEPVRADLHDCRRRLERLRPIQVELDVLRRRLARLQPGALELGEFYADFEERFRGTQELIRERQQYYLQFIDAAEAGTSEAPVLDLGCGRGEWLTLLREQHKVARGIDVNDPFLDLCREKSLEVTKADALQYLATCEPASLGAVTGFHIIEHMPADEQIHLLQLAFRALRPDGVLILETPNLEHLNVGVHHFYLDPTHVRPLPAELFDFAARHAGFGDVRTEGRAPSPDGQAAQGWSCYQDLALIAFRPAVGAEE